MPPRDQLDPPPAPAPGRPDGEAIVEAVIAAALELDDPGISVNTLAARAGVGVASLYRYFPSKAAVFAEISRRLLADFEARIRAVLAEPGLEVRAAVAACCRIAIVAPASPRLRRHLNLAVPASWSHDRSAATFRAVIDEMTAWLAVRLPAPPPDLPARVFTAFAAARGIVIVAMTLPALRPDDDTLVALMTEGSLAYLLAPGAAPDLSSRPDSASEPAIG